MITNLFQQTQIYSDTVDGIDSRWKCCSLLQLDQQNRCTYKRSGLLSEWECPTKDHLQVNWGRRFPLNTLYFSLIYFPEKRWRRKKSKIFHRQLTDKIHQYSIFFPEEVFLAKIETVSPAQLVFVVFKWFRFQKTLTLQEFVSLYSIDCVGCPKVLA